MPEAINYNIGFPGTPDNSKCIFPTQVFKGDYRFIDSILDADFKLKRLDTFDITLSAINNVALTLQGFCNGKITMTANRYYKSIIDSMAIEGSINVKLNGQYLCGNIKDTISGWILKSQTDTTKITVNFTVATDTGVIYHQGTGTRK